jgi:hypothetical protein
VTIGTATAIDLTLPGLPDFTSITAQFPDGAFYLIQDDGNPFGLGIAIKTSPTSSSLTGFTGGTLNADVEDESKGGTLVYLINTGTITPTITPAPEPSSVALMLLGVGLVFVMRKRIGQRLPQAS